MSLYVLTPTGVERITDVYIAPEVVARSEARQGRILVHPDGRMVVPKPVYDDWHGRFPAG